MMHKIAKIIALLIMFLVWPSFVLAAPNVTNVSGALSDGNEVTITGSSFGSTGPNVVVFDDFESGTVGEKIKIGAGSAKHGQWSKSRDKTYYGNTAKVSGSKSFTSDMSGPSHAHSITAQLPYGTKTFFSSYWIYLPTTSKWPGEGDVNNINWKQTWVLGDGLDDGFHDGEGPTTDDDVIIPVFLGDKVNPVNSLVSGNSYSQDPKKTGRYLGANFLMHKGEWKRIWVYMKGSSGNSITDGETSIWTMQGGSQVIVGWLGKNIFNLHTGGAWDAYEVNSYGRSTNNCTPSFDDVYVATGPNAQARVEVGNASTYTASTKLTILTPKSWTANSISAEVNKGNFPNGSAYLYVFDASGVPNTTGYPVTFGASGPDTTAPTVSSTVPTNNATGITKNSINSIILNEDLNCSTVNTSSVTMSPNRIQSVTCDNSVITITPQNQADSTTYTVTAGTAITNTAGLHLASPYTFSYTTATPSATCATDATLCTTASTCTTNHSGYNFCSGETPACKSTPCASTCSQENWYLCTNETDCENNNRYWWENACRTTAEPQLWYGSNLITNPKLDTWSNGLPVGWSSYIPSGVYQNSLGARIVSRSGIHKPSLIEPDTTYVFAYNLPVVTAGSSEIWYYNTSIFNSQAGTVTGSFTTPEEPISDHGFYFTSTTGSDIVINDIVLKRSTLTGCSTDPALCETEATCTAASWNYCDGVCKVEPCNADIPVAPCGLVVF